jgi:hypothetical protein
MWKEDLSIDTIYDFCQFSLESTLKQTIDNSSNRAHDELEHPLTKPHDESKDPLRKSKYVLMPIMSIVGPKKFVTKHNYFEHNSFRANQLLEQ